MFKTKLILLLLEYVVLLPLAGILVWKKRRSAGSSGKPARISLLPVIVTFIAITFPLAWVLDLGVYQSDEGAYLFEAHILNSRHLSMAAPAAPAIPAASFEHDIIKDGRWFGKFPYGWPALLALAAPANLEWIVNPVMGVLLLWLTYAIGRMVLSPEEAGYSIFFLLLSAFFTANCLGFMPHPACGVLTAAATLCYFLHERTSRKSWIVAMLLCLAVEVQMRPFTALCVAAVLGAATTWRLRKDVPQLAFFLICSAILGGAAIAVSARMNYQLIGDYFRSPYEFTPDGTGVSLRPADLIRNAIHRTPVWIADTAIVSFPFIFLLAGYGLWRRRREGAFWILALLFLALVGGHLVEIYDSDSAIGGRYYFEGFFGVALLAAAGWRHLIEDCRWTPRFRTGLATAGCLAAAATLVLFLAWEVALRWPTRQLTKAIASATTRCGVVFLVENGYFTPHRYNVNRPGNNRLYLMDLDPQARGRIARELGSPCWATLAYDPVQRTAQWTEGSE